MSHLVNPEKVMKALKEGTIKAIEDTFPITGSKHELRLNNAYIGGKDLDEGDFNDQRKARLSNRTWAVGVYGDMELVDKKTGKVLDARKKVKLLNLPHITRRYSYIVKGNEYQVDNQWRLKSGVYTRKMANGDLETQFNLAKGRGFRMIFEPQKRQFLMKYGTANVQLLPVLQALGVPDEQIQKAWGKEIYAAAVGSKRKNELHKLAKSLDKYAPVANEEEAGTLIRNKLGETVLREDTTELTLGRPFNTVNGDALLTAATKLLKVHRGVEKVDNRDALQFKELWSIEDFIPERIRNSNKRIERKIRNNLDRKDNIRSLISSDIFNMPVTMFFTSTSLPQQPSQVNPLDMINGHLRTTLLGPGGISNTNAVSFDAKLIDPSHLGFLDPVATPEGDRTGITLHLGLGVHKQGREAAVKVWDARNKKYVMKTPPELANAIVAFPDQYESQKNKPWEELPPVPKKDLITVSKSGGDPKLATPAEVDYVLPSSRGLFSLTSNMIPFLSSDSPNRAEMATRHLEQAISLVHREPPLVQVHTGERNSTETWEKTVGRFVAQTAPINGVVESVSNTAVTVKDKSGKKHVVNLYKDYPLNDKKSFINSTALVKKGDKVTKGQILADTSFTKDGVLSLGTNMRVGYLPFKGLVFEDGIVISETGAEKLASQHLYKERTYLEKDMTASLRKFRANFPSAISDENAKKLDPDGVIEIGQVVHPGDTIMAVMRKTEPNKEQLLLKGIHRSLVRPQKDASVVWEKAYPGVVTDVIKHGREVKVLIRTKEKADIGDKLSGRHGNKGVITAVIPDEEMPKDKDGNTLEVIYNPSGVPGRINPGQVLETNLGNVAKATGTTYAVSNFEPKDEKKLIKVKGHYRTIQTKEGPKQVYIKPYEYERGYHEMVKEEMEKAGVSATTELFDPDTGKSLGEVMVGQQYTLKLVHQVDKKMSSRAHGYGHDYDSNMSPKGGGSSGGQTFGSLGLFALLSHGATANIRDALTYKGDKTQDEIWTAIQAGDILPAPKPSFAYEKFMAYLKGIGVNVEKEGSGLFLTPLTDKELLAISNGALPNPGRVLRGKDLKPEEGGLFDEKITGGPGGDKWSHIALAEPIPNPLFTKAIVALLGIKEKDFRSIISGKSGFSDKGEVVPPAKAALIGSTAIVDALKKIDVKAELAEAKEELGKQRKSDLDKRNKRVKYLRMLDKEGLSPAEAYVMNNVPVLPPIFRPITAMEKGDINIDGINLLYKDVALLNDKLREAKGVLPDEALAETKASLYEAVHAMIGVGTAPRQSDTTFDGQARPPGILDLIAGPSPKRGFFQKRVLDRKQDLVMRSVIVPDLDLHLDEVGLPRKGAMKIYRPFVVKELVGMGYTPLMARDEIEKGSALANKALDVVVGRRPVLFKRDPVLHKFGIMGFKPKLHNEKSIHIHPLVVGGFNADFDGDTMSVFVPVTNEAVDEAYKMMPSKNLFGPAKGNVMYQPSLEGQLGLFLLTQFGENSGKKFDTVQDALKEAKKGNLHMTDVVSVGSMKTTPGRISFYLALPKNVRTDEILTDKSMVMGSKNLQQVLKSLATTSPGEFQPAIDKIKDLGFKHAYNIGFSFTAKDFDTLREIRDKHVKVAESKIKGLNPKLSEKERNAQIVKAYLKATDDMTAEAKKVLAKKGSALFSMYSAGVKPGWAQLQQLVLAPMLLKNAKSEIIPVPVTRSYPEGVDAAGYWVASSGARKGLIEKVQSVTKPGALSKQIMNVLLPYSIIEKDCTTTKGIALPVTDNDVIDRFTARATKMGKKVLPAGTLITPDLVGELRANKVSKIIVRSPLKCQAPKGLCGTCYGVFADGQLPDVGTNIGTIAGQALGERITQIAMKQFHTGGVVGGGSELSSIDRLTQILKLPEKLGGSAILSPSSAKVETIKKDPAGGWDVTVGKSTAYVPASRELIVKKGQVVKKGQPLTGGPINPKELLAATNIDRVQRYISDELYNVFAEEGVKRRNHEVVTKGLTNLGLVRNSGTVDGILKGDYVSLNHAANLNTNATIPMKIEPVLRGIETLPLDQTTDWIARLQYRRLKETLIQGAQEGWGSDIHGLHPAPGVAYSAELGKKKGEGPY